MVPILHEGKHITHKNANLLGWAVSRVGGLCRDFHFGLKSVMMTAEMLWILNVLMQGAALDASRSSNEMVFF